MHQKNNQHKTTEYIMNQEVQGLLELARSLIRDLAVGYPPEECAERPEIVVGRITGVLGDGYDFESGTLADER